MAALAQSELLHSSCSVDQRAQLLWDGLRERAPSVQLNATQLVHAWLQDACDQDPIKLLKLLNVEVHEGRLLQCPMALTC